MHNEACRKTANNELSRLIKMGCYYDGDTDMRISGSKFYRSYWWPIVRSAVMECDVFRCQLCSNQKSLGVHHIMPRHLGGSDHPFNLVTLCAFCHYRIHTNAMAESAKFCKNQMKLNY